MFGKQARYKEWKAYSRRLLKYLPRASLFIVHYVVVVLRMASDPFVYVAGNSTLPRAHSLVLKRESTELHSSLGDCNRGREAKLGKISECHNILVAS